MSTINTMEDFLEVLRENENLRAAVRRELLTEDLLSLPGQFSEMLKTQTSILDEQKRLRQDTNFLRNEFNALRGETNALRRDTNALREDTNALREDTNALREDTNALREDTNALREDTNTLRRDTNALRETQNAILETLASVLRDQREMRGDIQALRDDFQVMRGDIKRIEAVQEGHTNDIGELKGVGLETKLYNRGPSHIATLLSVRNITRIRVAERDDNSERFNDDILKALESGNITMEEYDRVLRTDMIVGALRMGTPIPVYAAIEASYSVTRDDITKVKETARVLGRVFPDTEIYAALYYMNIAPFIEKEAVEQGVRLISVRSLE